MTGRQKVARLESILDSHEAWEKRTLADLRSAGYKFVSIAQAVRYRKAVQTLARMDHDELVEAVATSMTRTKENH